MRELNPFNPWQLHEVLDQMLDQRIGREERGTHPRAARLPIDAWLTDDALILKVSLAGARPEDVDITFEGDTLVISANIPAPEVQGQTLALERYHGPVYRALRLDIPVDEEKAEAVFQNGVLTLTLPRADKARARKIQVKTAA